MPRSEPRFPAQESTNAWAFGHFGSEPGAAVAFRMVLYQLSNVPQASFALAKLAPVLEILMLPAVLANASGTSSPSQF